MYKRNVSPVTAQATVPRDVVSEGVPLAPESSEELIGVGEVDKERFFAENDLDLAVDEYVRGVHMTRFAALSLDEAIDAETLRPLFETFERPPARSGGR